MSWAKVGWHKIVGMKEKAFNIKVFIVDDHPVVRLGLRTMLESEDNITVVGMAGTAQETITEVQRLCPDVVLMDLRMPEMEGTEAIAALRRVAPDVRILVLTNYESDEYISRALQAGALGYLLKNPDTAPTPCPKGGFPIRQTELQFRRYSCAESISG